MEEHKLPIRKHAAKEAKQIRRNAPAGRAAARLAQKPSAKTKARLAAKLKRQVELQRALYQVADAASAVTDIQSFYATIHKIVGTLMHVENFVIILYDTATNMRSYPYYADTMGDVPPPPGPVDPESLLGQVLSHPRTVHFNRRQNEKALRKGHMFGTPSEDFVGVPLMADKRIIGGIVVQSYVKGKGYSEEDVRVLEFVARHIAIALTRAHAIQETRQRNAELQIINSVQGGLASRLEMQAIYDLVGDKLREIFPEHDVTINSYDHEKHLKHYHYSTDRGRRDPITSRPMNSSDDEFVRLRGPRLINENLANLLAIQFPDVRPYFGDFPLSYLSAPMMQGEGVTGYISLQNMDRENAFGDSEVRLLQTLANSMSVALENARLFDELRKRNRELTETLAQQTATSEVLDVISRSAFDLKPVFETIVERAAVLCEAEHAWAGRLVEGGILLDAYRGPSEAITREVGTVRYLTDELRHAGAQTVNLDDALEDPVFGDTALVQMAHMHGFLIVPLRREGKDIGSIILARSRAGRFTDRQVGLIETFADQAVIAIENVRLFTETQRLLKETEQRNAELAIINSVQEGLASRLDIQAIYELVGQRIQEVFGTQDCVIAMYDRVSDTLSMPFMFERGKQLLNPGSEPLSETPMRRWVIRNKRPLVIDRDFEKRMVEEFNTWPLATMTDWPLSGVLVPILAGDEAIGIAAVFNYERENAFSESDTQLLQTLANSMGVALENARLWEQERLYRKALQRELEIGREIQAGFLPETLPLAEGWEIAAALIPAREVAGDFYDAFELPDGNIGLVIADVCDKGVGAALFMTLIRSLIRITSNQEYFEHEQQANMQHSAAERIQRAMSLTNNYIAESHERSAMFTTLFFGILNPRNGQLSYANGGHEPPYIVRSGGMHEELRRTGPAVGAMRDHDFGLLETQLEAGDVLFAYTDGVPDCQDPHGGFFGHERLADLLQRRSISADEVVKTIETELREFSNGATQFDDITLLTVRRAGEQQTVT